MAENQMSQEMNELFYLFSYGTLQKRDVQLKLFGRVLNVAPDALTGYRVSTIHIHDPAFLSQGEEAVQKTLEYTGSDGDIIHGAALELTEAELVTADKYEPAGYQRTKVKLASGKEAWVYLFLPSSIA